MEKLRISKKDLDMFIDINQCKKFFDGKDNFYSFIVKANDKMYNKTKLFKDIKKSLQDNKPCNISLSCKKDDFNDEVKEIVLNFELHNTYPYKEFKIVGSGSHYIGKMLKSKISFYDTLGDISDNMRNL